MKKLILISAKAQHGKDFTANILKEKLEANNQKVLITHYADYLKFICKEYFGWDGTKNEVGRTLLQYIGTDKARKNNPNIWVSVINELIKAIGEDYDYILIPDTRFPNEIDFMKSQSYDVVAMRIKRLDFENSLTEEQRQHMSEIALDDYKFDYYIECKSGYDNVSKEVDKFISEVLYE